VMVVMVIVMVMVVMILMIQQWNNSETTVYQQCNNSFVYNYHMWCAALRSSSTANLAIP
jgi:hypothetical protein